MKKILSLLLVGCALTFGSLTQTGCQSTLDSSGVYHGDKVVYGVDVTTDALYQSLDIFLKWEKRTPTSDNIHKFAEDIRVNGPKWFASATALKKAYEANPTEDTRKAWQKAVDVIRAAVNESTKYLTGEKK